MVSHPTTRLIPIWTACVIGCFGGAEGRVALCVISWLRSRWVFAPSCAVERFMRLGECPRKYEKEAFPRSKCQAPHLINAVGPPPVAHESSGVAPRVGRDAWLPSARTQGAPAGARRCRRMRSAHQAAAWRMKWNLEDTNKEQDLQPAGSCSCPDVLDVSSVAN